LTTTRINCVSLYLLTLCIYITFIKSSFIWTLRKTRSNSRCTWLGR